MHFQRLVTKNNSGPSQRTANKIAIFYLEIGVYAETNDMPVVKHYLSFHSDSL